MISFETAQIVPLRALNISVRSKQSSGFKDAKNNPCGHIVVWPSSCPPQGRLPASHPTLLSPRCAALCAAQQTVSTIARPSAFFIDTVPPGKHLPRGALRQPAPRGPASKFHALKLRVCPVSAVALHQSFSLCPHGVHLLCHPVSVSIHRSGSALGELASPGSGWPCSSQCALPPVSAASSHDQARAPPGTPMA